MKINDRVWENRFPLNSLIIYRTRVCKIIGYTRSGNKMYFRLEDKVIVDPKNCRLAKENEIAKYIAKKLKS